MELGLGLGLGVRFGLGVRVGSGNVGKGKRAVNAPLNPRKCSLSALNVAGSALGAAGMESSLTQQAIVLPILGSG